MDRICFISLNEAAAQRAADVARRWLPGGTVRRGQWRSGEAWLDLATGRGGRNSGDDSYSWKSGWRDFAGMVAAIDRQRPIDAARRLAEFLGISGEADDKLLRQAAERAERIEKEREAKNATNMALAFNVIVPQAVPLWHPRAAAARLYLQGREHGRDVLLYGADGYPNDILFSADAFPDFQRPQSPLAVIALCRPLSGATPRAIHRIMILGDGRPCYSLPKPGKAAKKEKYSLGSTRGLATLTGGGIPADGQWGIAEGIEDAMAARQLKRVQVWSSIASGNMHNVTAPGWARFITIFADNDPSGVGLAEARKAAAGWQVLPQVEDIQILTARHGKDASAELAYAAGGGR